MFVQNHHSLEELQRLTKALTKKRIWLRHQAVVLAKQGHSAPAIARALGCSHRAVQAWVGRYNQGGLAALQERPHTGRPPRLAAADVPRFRDRLEAGPTPEDGVCTFRCQDLRRILEEEFGVSLRRQAIDDLLHRLDSSSLMPRPQHEQANPEVQEFFKEIVVEQIDAIAAAHPEEEIHTYFQDEARFGQKGTITRVSDLLICGILMWGQVGRFGLTGDRVDESQIGAGIGELGRVEMFQQMSDCAVGPRVRHRMDVHTQDPLLQIGHQVGLRAKQIAQQAAGIVCPGQFLTHD